MGSSSSRSLLILLLAEYVLPSSGTVPTRRLVDGLAMLDVSEPAARQAIRRLANDGWLVHPPEDRARWALGEPARRVLAEGRKRFDRAARGTLPWDGRWLLLRTSVPESQRALRHQLRVALAFQGFGSLGQGWWLSAHADAEETARAILERLGVQAATSFLATSGMIGADHAALVTEAWELDEARARYDKLIGEFTGASPADGASAFALYTRLVDAYRWALAVDPQLPRELLPDNWSGSDARRLLDEGYERWHDLACAWWDAA